MDDDKKLIFQDVGENDQISYTKIDITKACRVGSNFAVSFYQLDYQALTLTLNKQSKYKPEEIKLMPVEKIVMDFNAFEQFRNEINSLYENFQKSKDK